MATSFAVKTIPSPRGWPLIGTLGDLLWAGGAHNLHQYVSKRHQQLGPIYKEKIGPLTGIFISSPEYMRKVFALEGKYPNHIIPQAWVLYNRIYEHKRGLLFMEGEEWHKYRKILNNIILRPDSKAIETAVSVVANDLISDWKLRSPTNIDRQLYTWSLQNIVSILLGSTSYKTHKKEISETLEELGHYLKEIFVHSATLSLMSADFAQKWNLPPWKKYVEAVNGAFEIANGMMDRLRKTELDEKSMLRSLQETNLTVNDINRIVIDLILAAGDTTAYTTQWYLYLLAKHQNIQEEVFKSSDTQLIKGGLRETLRLYPVAPFITRYMPADEEIDGFPLKKGDLVIMSLYTSGREERSFRQAEQFQPDRWRRTGAGYQNVTNAQGSLPFAMGARSCIGRQIAETQIVTTIEKVVKNFHIKLENAEDIKIKLNLIAVPSKPLSLQFSPR